MWAIAGSRSVPAGGWAAISAALAALPRGSRVAVGCCVGVDAAVLAALPASRLAVFAAFGPGGVGAGSFSAVGPVSSAAAAGAAVHWWAGGGPAVPLDARLRARTWAVVYSASGLLVFPASPSSSGTWFTARMAARRDLPVIAVPLGFSPDALPVLGPGVWKTAPSIPGGWSWDSWQNPRRGHTCPPSMT